MPIDHTHIIKIASALAKISSSGTGTQEEQEAAMRSAVSRFYYAAYLRTRDYMRDQMGFRPHQCPETDLGLHERLWDWWCDTKGYDELAGTGSSLKGLRQKADYDPDKYFNDKWVESAKIQAAKIIDLVDQLENPPDSAVV